MKTLIAAVFVLSTIVTAQNKQTTKGKTMEQKYETVTLASGCFWCGEALFQRLEGVVKVESGYAGGTVPNPSYEQVCTGKTGHAEAVQVTFDPAVISLREILNVFWKTHDPTTLNRQGNDVGTQYRSAIFYTTEEQKNIAEEYKKELEKAKVWDDPIVTEITPFTNFYKAENYHQDYYNNHEYQPYCMLVINPKLHKFQKEFESRLKKEK
jgi:peptide-methionine (S)-S-oxide reductase